MKLFKKNNKNMPAGVIVISVLKYIGAAFAVLIGLAMMFIDIPMTDLPAEYSWVASFMKPFGVFFVLWGGFSAFLATALVKGQEWARLTTVILAGLGILWAIYAAIMAKTFPNIISLAYGGFVIWYLQFNDKVKRVFI